MAVFGGGPNFAPAERAALIAALIRSCTCMFVDASVARRRESFHNLICAQCRPQSMPATSAMDWCMHVSNHPAPAHVQQRANEPPRRLIRAGSVLACALATLPLAVGLELRISWHHWSTRSTFCPSDGLCR